MIGFSLPIFFVTFREAVEASVVVSVLCTFVAQTFANSPEVRKRFNFLVWLGTGIGLGISILIGVAFLVVWFKYANNLWSNSEALWEASFSLLAAILLTIMAIAFAETENISAKWNAKLKKQLANHEAFVAATAANANNNPDEVSAENGFAVARNDSDADSLSSQASRVSFMEGVMAKAKTYFRKNKDGSAAEKPAVKSAEGGKKKDAADADEADDSSAEGPRASRSAANALFLIPLITVLREGLEGMVFLGGIGISADPGTIPIAAIVGLLAGVLLGWVIYRAGKSVALRTFFTVSTIFLLFLASGLLVKSVIKFQQYQWLKRLGSTASDDIVGVYDPFVTMWYLKCCSPENTSDLGWQIFNALLGWYNQGTYASIATYISFWILISIGLVTAKIFKVKAAKSKEARRAARKQRRAEALAAVAASPATAAP
ncbi:iron permease FTR1 family-domain-containing protein [Zopfochytrium polystomum]|nr:iron permease FTR1 family-domain-containing protein [Zopfochytrium polystomum]